MDKLFLVTGAAGHIGSGIVSILKNCKHPVRRLVENLEKEQERPYVKYFLGDITKPDSLKAFFEGSEYFETYCIHAAGVISIQDKGDARLHMVNVEGTKNIIKIMQKT